MLKPKKTYPNAPEYTALKMHGNFTNDQILVKKTNCYNGNGA